MKNHKTFFKSIIICCCFSTQINYSQNFPINSTNPLVPANEKFVIGVNANPVVGSPSIPNIASFHNSPLAWRSNIIANSPQYTYPIVNPFDLNQIISDAINKGYRNIFIQRGQYVISNPIVINVDNVIIEGESNLTIIKPENNSDNGLFPVANSIFEISGKNNIIKNFSIDCSAFSGIMSAIELKSGAENNTLSNISIDNVGGAGANQTFQKGAIYLNNASSFIHNNVFDNIFMKLVNKGIVLNSVASDDGIRHNTFTNIKMDRARVNNIVFEGAGFKPFRNSFDNFSIQPFASQSNVLRDISGSRNVFNGFKIADWTSQGQVVNVLENAWATVITNFEMGNNKVHGSINDIDDQGRFTQLLFNERAGVMYSQLGFDGFNQTNGASSNNKSLMHIKGGLILSAEQGGVNNYYIPTAAPDKVLTCIDSTGRAVWKNGFWNHIAAKNINMSNFALTNVSNLAATPPLAATDPANPENPANTLPGLRLDNTGNVRIGTAAPFTTNPAKLQVDGRVFIGTPSQATNDYDANYKLLVNGKVLVRNEVYVRQGGIGWADYVFAKDYKLMPLQEVEQHIQQKGYLPNMPSAAEVERDGIAVGNIIKLQQEKIEELTLYLIEMKKQNDEMQKRMEALENNQKK